jgi:hypothetical protein
MLIPPGWLMRAGLAGLLAVAAFGGGWRYGAAGVQSAWDAERNAQALATARRAVRLADLGQTVVDNYTRSAAATATRTQKLREMTHAQLHDAPAGAGCMLQPGIVRLHDAAATGADPDQAATGADAAGPSASLDQLMSAVVDNYGACQQNAAQLTALQVWVGAATAPE